MLAKGLVPLGILNNRHTVDIKTGKTLLSDKNCYHSHILVTCYEDDIVLFLLISRKLKDGSATYRLYVDRFYCHLT